MTDMTARVEAEVARLRTTREGITAYLGDYADDYDIDAILSEIRDLEEDVIATIIADEYGDLEAFADHGIIRDRWTDAFDWDEVLAPILTKHDVSAARSSTAFAADLYLIGLNAEWFATLTPNAEGKRLDPRRVRQWCDGDRPIPDGIWDHLATLRAEHDALVAEWLPIETTITLPEDPRPKSWYKAAAARVRAQRPDARFHWQ